LVFCLFEIPPHQATFDTVTGKNQEEHALCPKCSSFYNECLSHLPIDELVAKQKDDKGTRENITEAKENMEAGKVPFPRAAVECETTNQHVVSKTVTILNKAEWQQEFREAPKKRTTRFVPTAEILSEDGLTMEQVWFFKYEAANMHLRSLTLSSTVQVRRCCELMSTSAHWYQDQAEEVFRWCINEERKATPVDSLLQQLAPSLDFKKAKLAGVALPDDSGERASDGELNERNDAGDAVSIVDGHSEVGASAVIPGSKAKRLAPAPVRYPLQRSKTLTAASVAAASGPAQPQAKASFLSGLRRSPSTSPRDKHGDATLGPDDSASQVMAAASVSEGHRQGQATVVEDSGERETLDMAGRYVQKLDLAQAMTVGKLGVQRFHATKAVRGLMASGEGDRAHALKNHVELYDYAVSLHADNISTLTEIEYKDAVSKLKGRVTFKPAVQVTMVKWRASGLIADAKDEASFGQLMECMWFHSKDEQEFDAFKPTLSSVQATLVSKTRVFRNQFVDVFLLPLIHSGEEGAKLLEIVCPRMQTAVDVITSSGDEVPPEVGQLLCELSTVCRVMSLVFDTHAIWAVDDIYQSYAEIGEVNAAETSNGTLVMQSISLALHATNRYSESLRSLLANKVKVMEMAPEVGAHVAQLLAIADKPLEELAKEIGPILEVLPRLSCSLETAMVSHLEGKVVRCIERIAKEGLHSTSANPTVRDGLKQYLNIFDKAQVAMPMEPRIAQWRVDFDAKYNAADRLGLVKDVDAVLVTMLAAEDMVKHVSQLEEALGMVSRESIAEHEGTMQQCELLLKKVVERCVDIVPHADVPCLLSGAKCLQDIFPEDQCPTASCHLDHLDDIQNTSSLADARSELARQGDKEGTFDPDVVAMSPDVARMQVLLERVRSACAELESKDPKPEGLSADLLGKMQASRDEASLLLAVIGKHLAEGAKAEATTILDDLAAKRYGMQGGGNWLYDLTPSQLGQWTVLVKRAEDTISKDASVARMRKPIEQATKAWLSYQPAAGVSALIAKQINYVNQK